MSPAIREWQLMCANVCVNFLDVPCPAPPGMPPVAELPPDVPPGFTPPNTATMPPDVPPGYSPPGYPNRSPTFPTGVPRFPVDTYGNRIEGSMPIGGGSAPVRGFDFGWNVWVNPTIY